MYRFIDHTGDFAVELTAPSRPELFAEATLALLDLLTGDVASVKATARREVHVEGIDDADLLVSLGNELLFLFEIEGFLCARLDDIELADGTLDAIAVGETLDRQRHPIARPLKAVTHHGALVESRGGELHARIVYDL